MDRIMRRLFSLCRGVCTRMRGWRWIVLCRPVLVVRLLLGVRRLLRLRLVCRIRLLVWVLLRLLRLRVRVYRRRRRLLLWSEPRFSRRLFITTRVEEEDSHFMQYSLDSRTPSDGRLGSFLFISIFPIFLDLFHNPYSFVASWCASAKGMLASISSLPHHSLVFFSTYLSNIPHPSSITYHRVLGPKSPRQIAPPDS